MSTTPPIQETPPTVVTATAIVPATEPYVRAKIAIEPAEAPTADYSFPDYPVYPTRPVTFSDTIQSPWASRFAWFVAVAMAAVLLYEHAPIARIKALLPAATTPVVMEPSVTQRLTDPDDIVAANARLIELVATHIRLSRVAASAGDARAAAKLQEQRAQISAEIRDVAKTLRPEDVNVEVRRFVLHN
jgi:hypothetical protein